MMTYVLGFLALIIFAMFNGSDADKACAKTKKNSCKSNARYYGKPVKSSYGKRK